MEKDGYALALRDEIGEVVGNMAFGEQMGDVLGYRSLEYYRRSIQPQIEMIDIFLKTEQPPYEETAVAEVLGLSAEALAARMQKEHLACITKGIFFRLLAEGENPLGGMLKRAVACGLPERYTPEAATKRQPPRLRKIWYFAKHDFRKQEKSLLISTKYYNPCLLQI